MLEQQENSARKAAGSGEKISQGKIYLCIHGHFYQPPRENPFTNKIPQEVFAAPFPNFNEKITTECYAPNALAGNFARISYDLGPTLASWLEEAHPQVLARIIEGDKQHKARYSVGNALAQAYNHTILPLANTRDKRTQIAWGLSDFRHRYGREATGMWLAETAVDLESLDLLAQAGITYTILAPWQAATPITSSEPYRVQLFDGRSLTVFFYNSPLSGGVSFDGNMTSNADIFATRFLKDQIDQEKYKAGKPQLILIATDGELYGHHQQWRDKFLTHLLGTSAPASGYEICSLEQYMNLYPATREVELRVPSSWSCEHGVARWNEGCSCTEGKSTWKSPLRQALNNLADRGNQLFEERASPSLTDPWAARDSYLPLHSGWEAPMEFWARFGKNRQPPKQSRQVSRTLLLLEAQYYQQCSFTSCGFFFEDLDRIEPRNDIAFARRAISLYWLATGVDLQTDFVRDLTATQSWRKPLTGADIYRKLPKVAPDLLPPG